MIKIQPIGDSPQLTWGVNKFPDGQQQFYCDSRQGTHPHLILASLQTPQDVDLFLQIWHTLGTPKAQINYLYGARSDKYTAGDTFVSHLPDVFFRCLGNCENISIVAPHCDEWLSHNKPRVKQLQPPNLLYDGGIKGAYDLVVFPDESARRRFLNYVPSGVPTVCCVKQRDQKSGDIIKHDIPKTKAERILVLDDLCDAGGTFVSIGKALKEQNSKVKLDLAVVHGVFSHLALNRLVTFYDKIFTTNSYCPTVEGVQLEPNGSVGGKKFYNSYVWVSDVWRPL